MDINNSKRNHRSRWLLWLPLGLGLALSSCASLQHSLPVSGAAAVGAGVCAAGGLEPTITAVCAGAAALGTEVAIPAKQQPSLGEVTTPEQRDAFIAQQRYNAVEDIAHWIIGGVVLIIIFLIYIGRMMPNARQKRLERMAFNNPDCNWEDLR